MQEYHGMEQRMYQREYASGTVAFKAFLGNNEYYKSHFKDYNPGSKYLNGEADLVDKSYGGMQIKTVIPLEKGAILEVNSPEEQMAMVRWVVKQNEFYYAGLMYT